MKQEFVVDPGLGIHGFFFVMDAARYEGQWLEPHGGTMKQTLKYVAFVFLISILAMDPAIQARLLPWY